MSNLPTATAAGGKKIKHRRHLSNYMLDKSLQLRYVAFVSVLSAVIAGSLGYLIYRQENRASDTIVTTVGAMGAGGDAEGWGDLQKEIGKDLRGNDKMLVWKMVGVGLGLVFVLSLYLVIMTHKVAGPLYKVTGYFDKMAAGKLGDVWPLRKGDMMQEFYKAFKDTHDVLRERAKSDNELTGRFLEACAAAGVSREGELGHELDEFETHHKSRTAETA